MDKSELAKRLMAAYLEELEEHLNNFNQDLLALEKAPVEEPRKELLHSMFRAAHSLKGASRAVDVDAIEQVCHGLEDILAALRDGKQDLSDELFALLFDAADAMEDAGMRLREEQSLADSPLSELLPRLNDFHPTATGSSKVEPTSEAKAEVAAAPATETSPPDSAEAVPATTEARAEPEPPPTTPRRSKSQPAMSVRVAAQKLDALLAQAGELLVVDDSVTSRSLLRSILEIAGYDVSVAVDGQQAFEMASTRTFDRIVSDVDMPRVDGVELTETLRRNATSRQLPVVLVTARSSDEDRARGVRAGADAYIVKSGFDQTELLKVISELL